jgi:hypothetical protein
VPGPFHRLESPTQTVADAARQETSKELWGRPASNTAQSDIPAVKAYRNNLPPGQRGVEFDTPVLPAKGSGTPLEARWYLGFTPGVLHRNKAGTDYAAIPLSKFVNGQP